VKKAFNLCNLKGGKTHAFFNEVFFLNNIQPIAREKLKKKKNEIWLATVHN
jgi:hypothetical protein